MLTRRVRVGDTIKVKVKTSAVGAPESFGEEIEVVALSVSHREVKLGLAGSEAVVFEHIPNSQREHNHE